jgi:hypothetical protein
MADYTTISKRSEEFTNEQLVRLLVDKGRIIEENYREIGLGGYKREKFGVITINEGGKPIQIWFDCYDLIRIVNFMAKEDR